MSARDDYPNAWATAEKGRVVDAAEIAAALQEIDDLRADHTEAVLLFGAASAELSALKARRCDGCAHALFKQENETRVECAVVQGVYLPIDHACNQWEAGEGARWCELCEAWSDHYAERCPLGPVCPDCGCDHSRAVSCAAWKAKP